MVVMWDTEKDKAVIPPDRLREEFELEPGQYRININFSVDGESLIVSRQFVIGRKADDLSWINPN